MGLVLRYQWESYMDCSEIEGHSDFQLIGEGFTSLSESKNAKKYVRKYHEDNTEQTDVIEYAPSISYSCDMITDNPVIEKIMTITDKELIGPGARVDIVTVNLWQAIGADVYSAYKRTYSIVPGGKGNGNAAMIYTGEMCSSSDIIPGRFVRSSRIFIPDEVAE